MNRNILDKITTLHKANIIEEELEKYYVYCYGSSPYPYFLCKLGVIISETGDKNAMYEEIAQKDPKVMEYVNGIKNHIDSSIAEILRTAEENEDFLRIVKLKDLIQNN